mmetsp:Transcript_4618/g.12079  ORF Transcript_4618/g.12079 Transcript_4618/m.12079 type:complete len:511 (+) Transcript_4618:208-1740(+)
MNNPGCLGLASSSIVPTKRYNEYTSKVFREFVSSVRGRKKTAEEIEQGILQSENWPLMPKHEKLVKKTIAYAQNNEDKLPKLGRRLRRRAQKGIRSNDVEYTCVSVLLFMNLMDTVNSDVDIHSYIQSLLEVTSQLLRSKNLCLRYQGVRLFKKALEQKVFANHHQGTVLFGCILEPCPMVVEAVEACRREVIASNSDLPSNRKKIHMKAMGTGVACLESLLQMATKFRLGLQKEALLLKSVSGLVGDTIIMENAEGGALPFVQDDGLQAALLSLQKSFFRSFVNPSMAEAMTKHLVCHFEGAGVWTPRESLEGVLSSTIASLVATGMDLSYFFKHLYVGFQDLDGSSFYTACAVVECFIGYQREHKSIPLMCSLLKQVLSLKAFCLEDPACQQEGDAAYEKTVASLSEMFNHHGKSDDIRMQVRCTLQEWQIQHGGEEEAPKQVMESVVDDLMEIGISVNLPPFDSVIQQLIEEKDATTFECPHATPFEWKSLLEEMLVDLASAEVHLV